jgi:hypothetical protein
MIMDLVKREAVCKIDIYIKGVDQPNGNVTIYLVAMPSSVMQDFYR